MAYDHNVFINCPFDGEYAPLFRAVVFAVADCGFQPRSALEVEDGSEVRLAKIVRLIHDSRFGIHDLSRTELDAGTALPRFNMPLELGLFLGAKYFGPRGQREKACIIFDRDRYRYHVFCSDIAGQDIRAHNGNEADVIRCVRDVLQTWRPDDVIPGGSEMYARYRSFVEDLPASGSRLRIGSDEVTFHDLALLVRLWLGEADARADKRAAG